MKAISWFEEKEEQLLELYEEKGGSPKAVWEAMGKPEEIKFNTFKGVLPVYVTLYRKFEERFQAQTPKEGKNKVPTKLDGWGVQRKKGRYFELYKRFGKKIKTIYVGTEWKLTKARKKIKEFELNRPE